MDPTFFAYAVAIKALKTFDALLLLADQGYGQQALTLGRTLGEDAVTASWSVRQSAEDLLDRTVKHEKSAMARLQSDALIGRDRLDFLKNLPIVSDSEMKVWLSKEGVDERLAIRLWTGETIRKMAHEIRPHLRGRDQSTLDRLVEALLLANLVTHNSPTSINLSFNPGRRPDSSLFTLTRSPSEVLVHEALSLAHDSMTLIAPLVISEEDLPALDSAVDEDRFCFVAVPSHSDVGRNDLCPCGSGKKYKKCHGL